VIHRIEEIIELCHKSRDIEFLPEESNESVHLWTVAVIFCLGQRVCNVDTSISKTERSSEPDNVIRSTVNNLVGESSKPWSNWVLLVSGDGLCYL
jgi:hypothetical protein